MRLGRSDLSIRTATAKSTRTKTATAKVTFGRDWLIYSTSVWPDPVEEEAWRQTFPNGYTSVVRLYRPAQFALALGLGLCEHVGVAGKPGTDDRDVQWVQDSEGRTELSDGSPWTGSLRR